jgi:predicted transcriptional regulator of viral defense system
MRNESSQARVLDLLATRGVMRSRDLVDRGIPRATLSRMVAEQTIDRVGRGLYALPERNAGSNHELAVVSLRVPRAVVGLLSALRFHELTTESPHEVWILLPRGARRPHLDHPPLRASWTTPELLAEGVASYSVDGVDVRVTSPARTVAEVFKHRNRIGLDVAVAALRDYLDRYRSGRAELRRVAEHLGVERVMRPYLVAMS